jgi:hypothetical protein
MNRTTVPLGLAVTALLLTGTGSAVAGSMITGAQIKNESITGADVKNRSLGSSELSVDTIERLAPPSVPSRTTVRGVWASSGARPQNAATILAAVSFPLPAPQPVAYTDVLIDGTTNGAACTGTLAAPTAPRGKVCVYWTPNEGIGTPRPSDVGVATRFGFAVDVPGTNFNSQEAVGTWAYTAP